MSRKKIFTERQVEIIRELYRKGVAQKTIAEIFKTSIPTVWKRIRSDYYVKPVKAPIPRSPRVPQPQPTLRSIGEDRRYKLSPEDLEELKEVYDGGHYTQTEIAKMFGVTNQCVRYHCIPGIKEAVNKLSMERHHLYVTPEKERERVRAAYYRRKLLFGKKKEGE